MICAPAVAVVASSTAHPNHIRYFGSSKKRAEPPEFAMKSVEHAADRKARGGGRDVTVVVEDGDGAGPYEATVDEAIVIAYKWMEERLEERKL